MFQQRVEDFRLVYGTWDVVQDNRVLLVQNISCRTSAHDLYMVFSRHGTLKVVDIVFPSENESRTLAFVGYQHAGEARKAMDLLQGTHVHGHKLIVQNAKFGRAMKPFIGDWPRAPMARIASTVSVGEPAQVQDHQTAHPVQPSRAKARDGPRSPYEDYERTISFDHSNESRRRNNRHETESKKIQRDSSYSHRSPPSMKLCSSSANPPPGFSRSFGRA